MHIYSACKMGKTKEHCIFFPITYKLKLNSHCTEQYAKELNRSLQWIKYNINTSVHNELFTMDNLCFFAFSNPTNLHWIWMWQCSKSAMLLPTLIHQYFEYCFPWYKYSASWQSCANLKRNLSATSLTDCPQPQLKQNR